MTAKEIAKLYKNNSNNKSSSSYNEATPSKSAIQIAKENKNNFFGTEAEIQNYSDRIMEVAELLKKNPDFVGIKGSEQKITAPLAQGSKAFNATDGRFNIQQTAFPKQYVPKDIYDAAVKFNEEYDKAEEANRNQKRKSLLIAFNAKNGIIMGDDPRLNDLLDPNDPRLGTVGQAIKDFGAAPKAESEEELGVLDEAKKQKILGEIIRFDNFQKEKGIKNSPIFNLNDKTLITAPDGTEIKNNYSLYKYGQSERRTNVENKAIEDITKNFWILDDIKEIASTFASKEFAAQKKIDANAFNIINGHKTADLWEDDYKYSKLEDGEKMIYNYLVLKQTAEIEQNMAEEYLYSLNDVLEQRAALDRSNSMNGFEKSAYITGQSITGAAENILKLPYRAAGKSMGMPGDRFGEGLDRTYGANFGENISNEIIKTETNGYAKRWYSLIKTIGDQIPAIVAGQIAGPVGGAAAYSATLSANVISQSVREAVQNNKSLKSGLVYGAIESAMEIALERMLGGIGGKFLGKGSNSVVVKVLNKIDDVITYKFPRSLLKGFVARAETGAGEWVQEFLQGITEPAIRNVIYSETNVYDEKTLVEALNQALIGFFSGFVLGGGANAAQTTAYYETLGDTLSDSQVLDFAKEAGNIKSELYRELSEKARKGKELTAVERGMLSKETTDLIYNNSTFTKETLKFMATEGSVKQISDLLFDGNTEAAEAFKAKFSDSEYVDSLMFGENEAVDASFVEQALNPAVPETTTTAAMAEGQTAPTAEGIASEGTEAVATETESATDSIAHPAPTAGKVLKMTPVSAKAKNYVKDIAKRLGINLEFVDMAAELEKRGQNIEGLVIYPEGFYDPETHTLYVGNEVSNPVEFVFKHELTHYGERSKYYAAFARAVRNSKAFKKWLDTQATYTAKDTAGKELQLHLILKERYKGVKNLTEPDAQREVVANFVADVLFKGDVETLSEILNEATPTQKNAVMRFLSDFFNWIKSKFTGSKQIVSEIADLENMFRELIGDAAVNPMPTESGITYDTAETEANESMSVAEANTDSTGAELSKGQRKYFALSKVRDAYGRLIRLFHGTDNGGFTEFDPSYSDDGTTIFTTDNRAIAESYIESHQTGDIELNAERPKGLRWTETGKSKPKGRAGVYTVYANLKNPLVIKGRGRNWNRLTLSNSNTTNDVSISITGTKGNYEMTIKNGEFAVGETTYTAENVGQLWGYVAETFNREAADTFRKNFETYLNGEGNNRNQRTDVMNLLSLSGEQRIGFSEAFSWDYSKGVREDYLITRDLGAYAKENGYDGVIIENITDSGGQTKGNPKGTIVIAFEANQIKAVSNENPTKSKDIRYSVPASESAVNEKTTTAKDSGLQFSIVKTSKMDYDSQLQQIENNNLNGSNSLYVGVPDQDLQNVGFSNSPFAMNQSDYRKSRRSSANNKNYSSHSVPFDFFKKLPKHLSDSVIFIDNGEKTTIVTDYKQKDTNGNDSYIIAGIWQNQIMESNTVNLIKSVYPLDDFASQIVAAARDGKLVITNKNKAEQMLTTIGVQPAEVSNIINLARDSLSQANQNVKEKVNDNISLSVPAIDQAYLSAVENGDMETAQRMVDEAAKKAGYAIDGYHGSHEKFTVFDREKSSGLFNFAENKQSAQRYAFGAGGNRRGMDIIVDENLVAWDYDKGADAYVAIGKTNDYEESGNIELLPLPTKHKLNPLPKEYVHNNLIDEYGYGIFRLVPRDATTRKFYINAKKTLDLVKDKKAGRQVFQEIIKRFEENKGHFDSIRQSEIGKVLNLIQWSYKNDYLDFWEITKRAYANNAFKDFIVPELKRMGYDSIYHQDDSHKTYVVFESNQIKSADPVTYDDNGNVIPLSERFNSSNNDIRFSVPASEGEAVTSKSLFDKVQKGEISYEEFERLVNEGWSEAGKTYGVRPDGEMVTANNKPQNVPNKVAPGKTVRRFVRNVLEANYSKDFNNALKSETLAKNKGTVYEVQSNKDLAERARKKIARQNIGTAQENWLKDTDRINPEKIAIGESLLVMAEQEGRIEDGVQLASELAIMFTTAGQVVQAARLFKRLGSIGKLIYLQKMVNKLNRDIARRYKNADPLVLNETLAAQLLETKTEEEAEVVLDAIKAELGQQMPSNWLDKWNAWRYMSMLVNPTTHIRNFTGNLLFKPAIAMSEALSATIQSGVGAVQRARGKEFEKTTTFKANKRDKDFAVKDWVKNRKKVMSSGKYEDVSDIEDNRRIYKNGILEGIRKGNSNLLEWEDGVFLKNHYVRTLARYLTANKINPETASEAQLDRARKYAIKKAQEYTYRDASKVANWLSKTAKDFKGADFLINGIIPFKKTPINILKRGIEYSPLGFIKSLVDYGTKVRKGDMTVGEFIDGLASATTGTGLFILGALLSNLGVLKGDFDDDDKWFEKLRGHQEYSIELFGVSYTINWAAPSSVPMFMGAAFSSFRSDEDGNWLDNLLSMGTSGLEPVLELTMLQGINDALDAVSYAEDNEKLWTLGGNILTSYATQGIPTIGGKIANVIDDKRRTKYIDPSKGSVTLQTMWDTFSKKVPFLSMTRAEYIDAWGREQYTGNLIERFFAQFVSPGYASTVDPDPIYDELKAIKESTGEAGVYPEAPRKYITVGGDRRDLTKEEYYNVATMSGQTKMNLVNEAMDHKFYDKLTDEQKAEVIKNIYKYANSLAITSELDFTLDEIKAGLGDKKGSVLTESRWNGFSFEQQQYLIHEAFMDGVITAYKYEQNGGSAAEYFILKALKNN